MCALANKSKALIHQSIRQQHVKSNRISVLCTHSERNCFFVRKRAHITCLQPAISLLVWLTSYCDCGTTTFDCVFNWRDATQFRFLIVASFDVVFMFILKEQPRFVYTRGLDGATSSADLCGRKSTAALFVMVPTIVKCKVSNKSERGVGVAGGRDTSVRLRSASFCFERAAEDGRRKRSDPVS